METTSNPGVGATGGAHPSSVTPAVPPPKPVVKDAAGSALSGPDALKLRRQLIWTSICAFLGANLLMFFRFFFPRTLFEPSTKLRVGFPSDFGPGVDERFKQSHRIWVVRQPEKLFVIFAKCTHLGCTPNWIEPENKFKCPCHGSGYDIEGKNFEGPAPRPMERAAVELDAEGQIVVDTSRLYPCDPGSPCEFETSPNSYLVI